jgi:hypothetical protein
MASKDFTFYLYQTPYGTVEQPTFSLSESRGMEEHGWALMRKEVVTVELPEPEDVRRLKLRALEISEQKLRAEFAARIVELQRQKNELLAIEMEAA